MASRRSMMTMRGYPALAALALLAACSAAVAGETVFSEDFEATTLNSSPPDTDSWTITGAGAWYTANGQCVNARNHTSGGSKCMYSSGGGAGQGIGCWNNPGWGPVTNGRASVWFYDDLAATKIQYVAVDNDTGNNWLAILVRTTTSTTKYCYRGSMAALQATTIDRTLGWHKVEWIRDTNNTTMYLDGVQIYSTANTNFSNFYDFDLGSWSWDSVAGNTGMWFDDCLVERGIHQNIYRWYQNNSAENPTQLAAENTAYAGAVAGTVYRLRAQLQNDMSSGWSGAYVALRYRMGASGAWTDLGAGAHWNYANGMGTNGAQVANNFLTGTDVREHFVESLPSTASLAVGSGQQGEWDFAMQATASMVPGATYYFEAVETDSSGNYLRDLMSYPVLAQLSTTATNLNVWWGTTSNRWNVDTNWSLGHQPIATESVLIPASASNDCQLRTDVTIASLYLEAGRILLLDRTGLTLTVNGPVTLGGTVTDSSTTSLVVTGGPVGISGTFNHSGTGTFSAAGVDVTIENGGQYNFSGNGTSVTCRTLTIRGSTGTGVFTQSTNTNTVNVTDLVIEPGGEYDCTVNNSIINVADDLVNNGSMSGTTGGQWRFTGASASITGSSTTTRFRTLQINSGATFLSTPGPVRILASAAVAAGASLVVDGGTVIEMVGGSTLTATGGFAAAGTSLLDDYVIIRGSGGNWTGTLAGDVDVAYARIQNLANAGLTLSSGAATTELRHVIFESLQSTAGVYLNVTGAGWDGYTFSGLGFKDVGAGPNTTDTVGINIAGGSVTMAYYATDAGYSYGETTDREGSSGDGAGEVVWGPLAATVADLSASPAASGGVLVSWRALSEWGCVAYRVSRRGEEVACVAARGAGLYEALDESPAAGPGGVYLLEAIDGRGRARRLGEAKAAGPYIVRPGAADRLEPYERRALARGARPIRRPPAAAGTLKLATCGRGFYQVTAEELASAGLGARAGLDLVSRGAAQPFAETQASGAGGGIAFYGAGYEDRYTDENVYWLGAKATLADAHRRRSWLNLARGGLTAAAKLPALGLRAAAGRGQTTYVECARVERDERYVPGFRNAEAGEERWFFNSLLSKGSTLKVSATLLDPEPGGRVRLRAAMRSLIDVRGLDPDHAVEFRLNGAPAGKLAWKGAVRFEGELEVRPGSVVSGDNEIALALADGSGGGRDYILLDYVEVLYERPLRAAFGELECALPLRANETVSVVGFAPGERVLAADVTDPASPELLDVRRNGSAAEVRVTRGGARRLYLAAESAWRRPAVEAVSRAPVPGAAVDYLVVAPEALAPAAGPLLEHHRARGLRCELVPAEEIYDSCGWGVFGPDAIRRYVAARRPSYLLLLGDATCDYRGRLSAPPEGTLPAFAVQDLFEEIPSDHPYSDPSGDGSTPSVAVGRLPARTLGEAETLVAKVLDRARAGGSPAWEAVLAADNDEPGFDLAAGEISGLIGGQTRIVSMSELGAAAARREMLAALSEGAWWCVYAGHGSSSVWAAEGLLRTSDGTALAAPDGSPQPVSVELTCLTGRFDGFGDSLAEAMLKHESGGFAGAVAPAGVADLAAQMVMARSLFPALRRGDDLGHALMAAKRAVWPVERRTAFSFNLLGDPAGR